MKTSSFLLLAGLLVFVPNVFAKVKLHHEPGLGVLYSNLGINLASGTGAASISIDESVSAIGPAFGYKIGVKEDYIFAYIDTRVAYMFFPNKEVDVKTGVTGSQTTTTTDLDPFLFYSYGLGVAFDWDVPIRLSLGMDIGVSVDPGVSDSDLDEFFTKKDGTGYKIGLAYYLNETSAISFEVQSPDFSGVISGTFMAIMVAWPSYVDYPDVSWRERGKGSNRWKDKDAQTFAPLEPAEDLKNDDEDFSIEED